MSDNGNTRRLIFKAEVVTDDKGKSHVEVTFESSHVPTLDYIAQEMIYHTTELRAMAKTEQEMKNAPLITKPGFIENLRKLKK